MAVCFHGFCYTMGMRIIAGHLGGRTLKTPAGAHTRPTTDRVRESLFSILGDHVVQAAVLDCFSGSGALGLEAWSRGASRVVFVDSNKEAIACIQANIRTLAPDAQALELLKIPIERALRTLEGQRFDLVFLDPPYDANLYTPTLTSLVAHDVLNPGALVVCEHHHKLGVLEAPVELRSIDQRRYGDTQLSFFEKVSSA